MNSTTTMEWTRGHTIGRGSSATVSVAKAHHSNELFAVKSTELLRSDFLKREQMILSLLKSNRVIGYLGSDITSEDGKLMYNLFMEYISGGTLTDSIQKNGGCLDEISIKSITCEILQGLEYLHCKGLVHCDIKGSNVLIGSDGVKIGDLGCARWIDGGGGGGGSKKPVIAGTPLFMAPEVARGDEQGFPADVWALGCTVIEMATGRPPWPEAVDPVSALYRIGFSGELPEFPSFLSEEAKDFLSKCLRRDPGKRWSVNQLLQHPFLKESNSSYSMQIDEPKKSISPSSILDQAFWDSMEVSETPTIHNGFSSSSSSSNSAIGRLQKISSPKKPNWTEEDNWVTIRSTDESSNFSTEDHNLSSSAEEPTTSSGSESDWIDQEEEEEEAEAEAEAEAETEFEKNFSSRRRRDRRSRSISVRRDSVKISKFVCNKDLIFERQKKKIISSLNPILLDL